MPESDTEFTQVPIHLCEGICYHYLQMDLTRMKLSFSLLKASSQVILGLKYFYKTFFIIFDRKKGLILLLQHAAFENGHTLESINLVINTVIPLMYPRVLRHEVLIDYLFTLF